MPDKKNDRTSSAGRPLPTNPALACGNFEFLRDVDVAGNGHRGNSVANIEVEVGYWLYAVLFDG